MAQQYSVFLTHLLNLQISRCVMLTYLLKLFYSIIFGKSRGAI